MNTMLSFALSVAANVVAHCICKWLDEQFKAGKHYMDECTYVLKDTPETMEKYPFHFELEITQVRISVKRKQ